MEETSLPSVTTLSSTLRVQPLIQMTSLQKHQVQKKVAANAQQYTNALKQATKEYAQLRKQRTKKPWLKAATTLEDIVQVNNQKFGLSDVNCTKRLSKSTVHRYVVRGCVDKSPKKKGPQPKAPDSIYKLLGLHGSMLQCSLGEATPREMQATLKAAVSGTNFESLSLHHAWAKARKMSPEHLMPAGKVAQEDIRGEWTTYTNLKEWLDDGRKLLLEYGFAIDKPCHVGEVYCDITVPDNMLPYVLNFDETHHKLSNNSDTGGSCARTYVNPSIPRAGSRMTRGSDHTTGVYGAAANGEMLPPLYIFDSSAKEEENFQVKVSWVKGLPKINVKLGLPEVVEVASYAAVSSSGSMTKDIFYEYLLKVILPLFPKCKKGKVVQDEDGKLVFSPLIVKVDTGPGRLGKHLRNLEKRKEAWDHGIMILLGLPNLTLVSQELDWLFRPFKAHCRQVTLALFGEKIAERAKKEMW